jgi:hypothetical protein
MTLVLAAAPLPALAQCGGHNQSMMGSGQMGSSGHMGSGSMGSGQMGGQTGPGYENNANYVKPYYKSVPRQPVRARGEAQSGQMNENPSQSDHDHTNH